MKFQMILDQEKEEAVFARVHKRTALVDEIEKLVLEGGQGRSIAGYDEDGIRMLEIGAVEAFYVEGDKTFAAYQGGKYRVGNVSTNWRKCCRNISGESTNRILQI